MSINITQTTRSCAGLIVLILLPVFSFGQWGEGVAKLPAIIVENGTKAMVPFVEDGVRLGMERLIAKEAFLDPAWVKYWNQGLVPPETFKYIRSQAIIEPIKPIPGKNVVIASQDFPLLFDGVGPDFEYGAELKLNTDWFPWQTYKTLDEMARQQNLTYQTEIVRSQVNNARFYGSLCSKKINGDIPFKNLLPSQRVDRIYLGIEHGDGIEAQVVNMVRAAKDKYKSRPIIVATEYVWDSSTEVIETGLKDGSSPLRIVTEKGDEEKLNIAHNQEELWYISDGDYDRFPFLKEVIEMGIPVVGIEPGAALVDASIKGTAHALGMPERYIIAVLSTESLNTRYQHIATTEGGMWLRNDRWASNLDLIEKKYPRALIIVVGGARHLAWSERFSVPNLISPDRKSFSLMLVTRQGKDVISPLGSGIQDTRYDEFVSEIGQGKHPRYLLGLKKPSVDGRHTEQDILNAKRALGGDVMVVFP